MTGVPILKFGLPIGECCLFAVQPFGEGSDDEIAAEVLASPEGLP